MTVITFEFSYARPITRVSLFIHLFLLLSLHYFIYYIKTVTENSGQHSHFLVRLTGSMRLLICFLISSLCQDNIFKPNPFQACSSINCLDLFHFFPFVSFLVLIFAKNFLHTSHPKLIKALCWHLLKRSCSCYCRLIYSQEGIPRIMAFMSHVDFLCTIYSTQKSSCL